MIRTKEVMVGVLATAMLMSSLPSHASMVGTEQMLVAESEQASLQKVDAFLASEQVASQLQAWGVAPDEVALRVAALSESELEQLTQTIESNPAGGDGLVIVGIVFVVLLILELVGVTNLFTSF